MAGYNNIKTGLGFAEILPVAKRLNKKYERCYTENSSRDWVLIPGEKYDFNGAMRCVIGE